MSLTANPLISVESIIQARKVLNGVAMTTPLSFNANLSEKFASSIFLKREDLQVVRSYKIRGAHHKIQSLTADEREKGIIAASAGNHSQGVAYSCNQLQIHGKIFMPAPTTHQKVDRVQSFGKSFVTIELVGDTFDDAYEAAMKECEQTGSVFIHPFDDVKVIQGQGTVGLEIIEQSDEMIDFLVLPIGGGGLSAGVSSVFKTLSPKTKIIGVEPEGAPAMKEALKAGQVVTLDRIEKFVDGAAVKAVGKNNFAICKDLLDEVVTVPEGKVCSTILELYNDEGIIVEPAGALTVAALEQLRPQIKGGNTVCVLSGGNNDIVRMAEIKERSLLYEGLKQYFIVTFPQRAGALREFLNVVLGPTDDIVLFEYTKKTNRENGPALIGIELEQKEDLQHLIQRMEKYQFDYQLLNENEKLFRMLI